MRFSFSKSVTVLLLFFFFAAYSTPTVFAQTGRSVSPPTFPQCSNKLIVNGDAKHETEGSHPVVGHEDIDGSRNLYTLTDGNFVECTCPSSGDTGIQTNWWYISGLPLGKVDIDAYVRDGWNSENGRDWDLLDGNYLAKTEDFSCKNIGQSRATKTPTPTKSFTATPTSRVISNGNISPTPSDIEDESLPETGLPIGFFVTIASLGAVGMSVRKYFTIR
jgi:hypothetical protein